MHPKRQPVVSALSVTFCNRRCKLFGESVQIFYLSVRTILLQHSAIALQSVILYLYPSKKATYDIQRHSFCSLQILTSLIVYLSIFLYFGQHYSFIETYSIRYDKTLLYIFMFRCDNILILSVLPAFEPNRIALRFHLKYS